MSEEQTLSNGPIKVVCDVCGQSDIGSEQYLYDTGWRMKMTRGNCKYYCYKHAKIMIERALKKRANHRAE